ncbi:MAG: DNA-binding response regulator [Bacteroidetes bacterium HGW-Bacteroidetes-9]|jgi:DNA-binding NarL/FixJ family response regulator|nr:MAG: DNA-binding response regulator [Bacteroidetes bacterium HGW-Bacteroidetes-9]
MSEEENKTVSILIADDHQMFIDGLKALLKREKNIQVIGEVSNGDEALEFIRKQQPDLLITDISMPGMSGVELTRKVKQNYPDIKVLVLSMYNDREIVSEILMSEAEGYILKNTGRQELMNAIHRIADNSTYYSNEVLNIMMTRLKKQKTIEKNTALLTPREIEIVKLIMEELSSEEIADKLFISKRTVDTHRKNIIQKTNTRTLVGLLKFAIENNLVDFNQ